VADLSGVVLTLQHQYEVLGKRRSGQLATVWRGSLRGFDVPVDIVVADGIASLGMPPSGSRAVSRRIAGLAKLASRVRSPHLARVVDYGEFEDGTPFFVTDQSGGTSLADVIAAQGRLPLSGTVQVVEDVAKALAALHDAGCGHLAVRAENVAFEEVPGATLTRLGSAGLGLLRHEVAAANAERLPIGHLAPLTEADGVATREWLAALRGDADAAEWTAPTTDGEITSPSPKDFISFDVYGLAVLAYRCLTGRHPHFDVDDDEEGFELSAALRAMDEGNIRHPSELGVTVPDAVWRALRGGLARDPGARPPGALAFAEALRVAAVPEETQFERVEVDQELPSEDLRGGAVDAAPSSFPWWGLVVAVLAVTNFATLLTLFLGGRAPVVVTEPSAAEWVSPTDAAVAEAPAQGREGRALTAPGRWRIQAPGAHPVELVWDGDKITLHLVEER
jgi:serine/threonine protein kinase